VCAPAAGAATESGNPVHSASAAAQLPVANGQLNLLLLGTDVETAGDRRADSIVLVALHKATGQVNLVSLPRDLYVYLPGNSMGTINTAVGSARFAPDGALALAQQTVLYNFGFAAHYVVWVDIPAFIQIVDTLGGIEVPVPCDFSDRILKAPGLDSAQPRNWAEFRVRPGLQKMDGAFTAPTAQTSRFFKMLIRGTWVQTCQENPE
jgi:anionic cell wall polymer biosynthesis LytR-Cps2A-Psr (LCP) family protein